jgi:hypothetical protein
MFMFRLHHVALWLPFTLGVLALTPESWASGPTDTVARDASAASEAPRASDIGPAPANCPSAIARQTRLSEAAAVRRMQRSAILVTRETIAQAEDLAAKHWERVGVAFIVDSTKRGRQHLQRAVRRYEARVGEVPRETCRALAARDLTVCRGLPEHEVSGCTAWIALRSGLESGCDQVAEPLRAACTLLRSPGSSCPAVEGPGREACLRVQGVLGGVERACASTEGETACTWAALISSLAAKEGDECEAVRPAGDRRSPRAKRTHTLCQAVVGGHPLRCPADTSLTQFDDVVTWIESRVLGGGPALRIATNLQVDRPSVCAVEVGVSLGDEVVETQSWLVAPGSQASVPDWRALTTKASPFALVARASAVCVLRQYWGP